MTAAQVARLKKAFLEAFEDTGNITTAARTTNVARRTIYNWKADDPEFAASFSEAEITATEIMEEAARDRAVNGVTTETPIYDKHGDLKHTLVETKYSDTLLIFLLKARNPAKYRERVDLTHANGENGPLEIVIQR